MNDQSCNEATAWTCRQPVLSQGHCATPSSNTASQCVAPTGNALLVERTQSFVPGLVEHYVEHQTLPISREVAVVFVDIADSASTLFHLPPAQAMSVLQRFSQLVTDLALAHCGDVKDYEGDGALLYFGSLRQAARAALAIREALSLKKQREEIIVQARISLNVGTVSIGVIGSARRRAVALLGPSIHLAARLLKEIPPGGIIAPQTTIERLRNEAPEVAEQFTLWGSCLEIKGFEEGGLTAYHIPPAPLPSLG